MELVVGPAAALLGLVVGWILNRKSEADRRADERSDERARWFRDNRLRVYLELSAALRAFQDMASQLDRTDYTSEQAEDARMKLIAALGPIGTGTAALSLIAPRAVAQIAAEVEFMCIEAVDRVVDRTPLQGTLDRQRAWLALGRWSGTLYAAARADLEGHPVEAVPLDLPDTPRWERGKGWLLQELNQPT